MVNAILEVDALEAQIRSEPGVRAALPLAATVGAANVSMAVPRFPSRQSPCIEVLPKWPSWINWPLKAKRVANISPSAFHPIALIVDAS